MARRRSSPPLFPRGPGVGARALLVVLVGRLAGGDDLGDQHLLVERGRARHQLADAAVFGFERIQLQQPRLGFQLTVDPCKSDKFRPSRSGWSASHRAGVLPPLSGALPAFPQPYSRA